METTTGLGHGPRSDGGAMLDVPDLTEQTVPSVRVIWTTTRQYSIDVPATVWARLDGAEGPTQTRAIDGYLEDLEKLPAGEVSTAVIERNVDMFEDAQ